MEATTPEFLNRIKQIDPKKRIQEKTYYFKDATQVMTYTLYVPTTYDPTKQTPLTVMLHGLSHDSSRIYDENFVEHAEQHGHILVCPTGYNKSSWYGAQEIYSDAEKKQFADNLAIAFPEYKDSLYKDEEGQLGYKDVMNVIGIVRNDYNVDASRIYLAGHSMGGCGAYYIAYKNPHMFAAVGTIAPGIARSASLLKDMIHLPVICVQGNKDTTVPHLLTRYWVQGMRSFGMTHKYIEYPDDDHTSITQHSDELFKFFDDYTRDDTRGSYMYMRPRMENTKVSLTATKLDAMWGIMRFMQPLLM